MVMPISDDFAPAPIRTVAVGQLNTVQATPAQIFRPRPGSRRPRNIHRSQPPRLHLPRGTSTAPERIKWNPNLSDRGVLRLALAVHTNNEGQPPDRPCDDPNKDPCSYCPFRKICWSDRLLDELQPLVRGAAIPPDHDQETFEAAAQCLQAKQALDQAKIVLESKLIANAPISAADVKAEYFRPSDARGYDMHEFGRYLTGEILRRHQNANADKRVFWVHPL